MKISRIKYTASYFFLVVFLSMKMAGFRVISHANDKDHAVHCTICDHAITHNLIPVIAPGVQDFLIENKTFFVQRETVGHYTFFSCGTIAPDQLFSRPPPSI